MVSVPTGPGVVEYATFWVQHANGTEFEVKPYTAAVSASVADVALQSLVNHLQTWGDLIEDFTVTATKRDTEGYAVTADPEFGS